MPLTDTARADSIQTVYEQTDTNSIAYDSTTCGISLGNNAGMNNYSVWASTATSYISVCSDGRLMRVQMCSDGSFDVEYYSSSLTLSGYKHIPAKLPKFLGFYAASDGNYYVLSGQDNPDESDSCEVFRVTKYSGSWAELSHASFYGENTYKPETEGCSFADDGQYLIVRAAHTMYQSDDGFHHQANVTFQIKMSDMSITDKYTKVMWIHAGYVSHSFRQFVRIDDGHIIAADHGDAHPRGLPLMRYTSEVSGGRFSNDYKAVDYVMAYEIPNDTTGNYNQTGFSIGGLECSDSSYLLAINTIDLAKYDYSGTRNIAVICVPKNGSGLGTPVTKQITSIPEGGASATTPFLVKVSDNRFFLIWSQNDTVFYTTLDGSGNKGAIYSFDGKLSDCQPIVYNSYITWYTCDGGETTFWRISTSSPSVNSSYTAKSGHDYQQVSISGSTATLKCSKCGAGKTMTVPTSLTVYKSTEQWSSYWSGNTASITMDQKLYLMFGFNPSDAENNDLDISYSEPGIVSYDRAGEVFTPLAPGEVTVTFAVKFNPSVKRSLTITVTSEDACSLTFPENVTVTKNGNTLRSGCQVLKGDKLIITAVPPAGKKLEKLCANSVQITSGSEYTVTGDTDITAAFADASVSMDKLTYSAIPDQLYTGKALTPEPVVKYGSVTLVKGADYILSYSGNTDAGTASVIVTGKGIYTGSKVLDFNIVYPLTAPSGIKAQAGDGKVTLTWDAVPGALKYAVSVVGDSGSVLLSNRIMTGSYTAQGLTNGKTYSFVVRTYNGKKWSAESAAVSAVPAAPLTVSAVGGNRQVQLSWNGLQDAVKYAVKGISGETSVLYSNKITGTSYTVTGLDADTEYTFTVMAYNGKSWFVTSSPVKARTQAVISVSAKAGETSAVLSWSAVPGAVKYAVTRICNDVSAVCSNKITATDYTAKDLESNTEYTFIVQAYNGKKWFLKSDPVTVRTKPVPVVTATAGTDCVTLRWNAVPGAQRYAVSYLYDGTKTLVSNKITSLSYTVKGLTGYTLYGFVVQYYDGKKWSGASKPVYAEPLSLSPDVSAVPGDGCIHLSWNAVPGAAKYAVIDVTNGGDTLLYNRITATGYTVSGLTNGAGYSFKVLSYIGGKWSSQQTAPTVSAVAG